MKVRNGGFLATVFVQVISHSMYNIISQNKKKINNKMPIRLKKLENFSFLLFSMYLA